MSTRVGLIVPSSNSVIEVDFYRRLPADTTLHTARMYLVQTTPEGESRVPLMLKTWLDDNLPGMVERLVRAEIERVSRGRNSA